MREATVVLNVLHQVDAEQYTPHRAAELASQQRRAADEGGHFDAEVVRLPDKPVAAETPPPAAAAADSATPATAAATPDATPPPSEHEQAVSAEALMDWLDDDTKHAMPTGQTVRVAETAGDSLPKAREAATDRTGKLDWIPIDSPQYPLPNLQSK